MGLIRKRVSRMLNTERKQVFLRLKQDGYIDFDTNFPIIFLSLETDSFEEISKVLSEGEIPLIVILNSPLWYVRMKEKQWSNHIVIPYADLKGWLKDVKSNFVFFEKKEKVTKINNVLSFLDAIKIIERR
ncbi:hypothetical protein [Paenibacillus amylolyticus]|nr:hypothetical protein [Paenibacillus amylolyticus]